MSDKQLGTILDHCAMTTWMWDNPMNPYPTKARKLEFATKCDMTLTQVSTWFANERRRNKKREALRKKTLIWDATALKTDQTALGLDARPRRTLNSRRSTISEFLNVESIEE